MIMYDITNKVTNNPDEIVLLREDYSIYVSVRNDQFYNRIREIIYELYTTLGGEIIVKEYKRWGFYECSQVELHNLSEDALRSYDLLPHDKLEGVVL